ncbi:hypothetical protein TNCV_4403291 [Trichonephila clavipes]|uniref:Uncharacterized protein n=1 Tax=Trichonephila clavipes TaxID=2585209 RepID=A0A8X6V5K1_TRICX|nr:hypothetical protein TNCV_4403291 [Trichonephila clavipes]
MERLLHVKSVKAQSPPVGVVLKLGEGVCQLRCYPRHLTRYEGRLELGTFRSENEYLSHHAKTIVITWRLLLVYIDTPPPHNSPASDSVNRSFHHELDDLSSDWRGLDVENGISARVQTSSFEVAK